MAKITPKTDSSPGNIELHDNDYIDVIECGNVVDIRYMQHVNTQQNVQRVDKDHYVILSTGELKEIEHGKTRMDNRTGLYKTFKRLRELINTNFTGAKNELWLTLTYRTDMRDTEQLYKDFKGFIERLRRAYPGLEYIAVIEPTAKGVWHYHTLLKWPDQKIVFIDNSVIEKKWRQGFTKTRRLENITNIGAYISAYLTDIPVDDGGSINDGEPIEKVIDGKPKRVIKGGRLKYYPVGIRYYRCSKNIKEPTKYKMSYKKALKKVHSYEQTYTKNIFIETDDFNNAIKIEQYTKKYPKNSIAETDNN